MNSTHLPKLSFTDGNSRFISTVAAFPSTASKKMDLLNHRRWPLNTVSPEKNCCHFSRIKHYYEKK
jgi:hypothetical protein